MLKTREVGVGRPLVVLPGFGLDGSVMAACFEPARPPGWRGIYVDLPGMGSPPTARATSEAVLEEVLDTVERVGEPVALAAHSYGGYLAAGVTRRRPELLERVLLVCPGVVIDRAARDLGGVLPSAPVTRTWLDDVPEPLREHFTQAVGRQERTVARTVAQALAARAARDDDFLEQLQADGYALDDEGGPVAFDRPITLVAGRQDRVTGYRDQLRLLESYPRGTFTAMAGAGHYLPFEQPGHFAAVLRDWLSETD